MEKVKITRINKVLIGKTKKSEIPYVRILCSCDPGRYCQATLYLNEKGIERSKSILSHFKLTSSFDDFISAPQLERSSFLKPPDEEMLVEVREYTRKDGIVAKSYDIVESVTDRTEVPEEISSESIKAAWSSLQYEASDITKETTKSEAPKAETPKDGEENPF